MTNVLDEGERDYTQGFQIQPELRFYLGIKPEAAGPRERAFRGSLGIRSGYARYNTDVTQWVFLTDASGQPYEKLLGYTRRQQNFDMAMTWNQKIYFNESFEGFGMEIFAGLGLRLKRFQYVDLSPELDADRLRRDDESVMFSLRRNGIYRLDSDCSIWFHKKMYMKGIARKLASQTGSGPTECLIMIIMSGRNGCCSMIHR